MRELGPMDRQVSDQNKPDPIKKEVVQSCNIQALGDPAQKVTFC